MRIKNKNKLGYTLAEIMVVLLVVTIIFAAFAPLFTGRIKKTYRSKYNVWSWADFTSYDAFAAPSQHSSSGELIFGATPNTGEDINTIFSPLSRVIIRSGDVTQDGVIQRQIQFRYGRTPSSGSNPNGTFAGTWFVDNSNYLLGGGYKNLNEATNNTAIGYDALTSLISSTSNTAIGYAALSSLSSVNTGYNVAIGYLAGQKLSDDTGRNTFIGSGAGVKNSGYNNLAVGYNAMGQGYNSYTSNTTYSGYRNTFIGYNAGFNTTTGHDNVGVGNEALKSLTTGHNNVAIGYGALQKLTTGYNNVAIGYNACSEVVKSSNKTCIGYNSGPHSGTTAEFLNARGENSEDTTMRTYIGSKPHNYGGDAVLEIHNPKSYNMGVRGSTSDTLTSYFNTTTVINGNLIVRGRPYFTVGQTLHHFTDVSYYPYGGTNPAYYYGKRASGNAATYAECALNSLSYPNTTSPCISLYTSAAPTTTSDRRLKNIDGKYTLGMDRLRKVKVYNYTFKDDKNKLPHVGVIAQELQKIFPTAVFQGEDGYLRIRWDEMFYAMINGIKEIDRRIVTLVKRMTNVETQISQLEKENTELKTQVDNLTVRINKLKAQ